MKLSLSKRQLLWLSRTLIALAVAVLVVGMVIAWRQHNDNQVADRVARHSVSAPKINKPTEDKFIKYQVPPDIPRYLFIPRLSVQAMVKPMGLTAKNQIASPSNVFDAGWYTGSAKPGQPGAMLIDGHASSWTSHGIFYNLKKLQPGDQVQVQRGDGQTLTYKVVKSQTYDADNVDMKEALASIDPNRPALNLITCDGSVIKGTNEFNKRIVVFTKQI